MLGVSGLGAEGLGVSGFATHRAKLGTPHDRSCEP